MKMKSQTKISLFSIVLIFLLVLASGNLLAQKKAIFFEGISEIDFNAGTCGDYTCPGGEPNNLCYGVQTFMPCYSNFHMRDREMVFNQTTLNEAAQTLFDGIMTMVVNWNWRVDEILQYQIKYSGPMWATFTIELLDGGTWEGTATGDWDGPSGIGTWDFVGHGTGGAVEGMQLKMSSSGLFGFPNDVQGRILRPGKP